MSRVHRDKGRPGRVSVVTDGTAQSENVAPVPRLCRGDNVQTASEAARTRPKTTTPTTGAETRRRRQRKACQMASYLSPSSEANCFFEEKITRAIEAENNKAGGTQAQTSPRLLYLDDNFVSDEGLHTCSRSNSTCSTNSCRSVMTTSTLASSVSSDSRGSRFSRSDEDDDADGSHELDASKRWGEILREAHRSEQEAVADAADADDDDEEEEEDDDDQEPVWRGSAVVARHLLGQGLRMVNAAEAEADPSLLDHAIELFNMAIGEAPSAIFEARAFQALATAFEQSPVRQAATAAPLLEKSADLFLQAGETEQATAAVLRLVDDLIEGGSLDDALRACRDYSRRIPNQPLLNRRLVDLVLDMAGDDEA